MYHMKSIINHNEAITLPKCMYFIRNPNESLKNEIDDFNLNIGNQVKKFLKVPKTKMDELEQRQDLLLKKLDYLYDRIKTISSYCNSDVSKVQLKENSGLFTTVPPLHEAVLVVNADNMPWYLNYILKSSLADVNVHWHIHSSVPNEKVPKIQAFVKNLKNVGLKQNGINLRLIFKSVSTDSELKLNCLSSPIMGTVNILRYLAYAYPSMIAYDSNDFNIDSLLDICHLLEKSPEKNRDSLIKKLFANSKDWIYNNHMSIVDLAAANVVKQSKYCIKLVPKSWYEKCDLLLS